jgi:hypothetical protein
MPSPEALATLRREMANDLTALTAVAQKIRTTPERLRAEAPAASLVVVAFEIHNYYSVSENLMRRVAVAFENALDPTEWHKQLLARMALDIPGIRPALIDAPLRASLDELRKFRHFFRNAYDRELDRAKVADVLQIQIDTHGRWPGAIQRFMHWLDILVERASKPQ